jgi:hypothetical protein
MAVGVGEYAETLDVPELKARWEQRGVYYVAPQELHVFLHLLIKQARQHTDPEKVKLYLDKMKEVVESVWPIEPTVHSVTKCGRLEIHIPEHLL